MPRPSPALAFLRLMTIFLHTHLHGGHPWAASEKLYPSVPLPSSSFMLFTLLLHQRGERENGVSFREKFGSLGRKA